MSKRLLSLLVCGIAVVVLVGVLFGLTALPAPEGSGTTTTTVPVTPTIPLWKKEKAAVAATIPNEDGEFTLKEDSNGLITVVGQETLPHNTWAVANLMDLLKRVEAVRMVTEHPDDPKTYGFDKEDAPAVSVKATYADGSTVAFEVGDAAPSATAYYLRKDGETAIYLVENDYVESYFDGPFDYLSKSPITAPESNQAATDTDTHTVVIRDAELSGSVREEPLYFQVVEELLNEAGVSSSPSGYVIKKPYYRAVKVNSPLVEYTAFSGFTAHDVIAIYPTEKQLEDYGLNTPYSVAKFNLAVQRLHVDTDENGEDVHTVTYYNVFEYTVKLGNKTEDGQRYALVYSGNQMIPIVYLIPETSVKWATTQYDDMADSLLFYIHIRQIDRLSVTVDGVTTAFDLTHVKSGDDTYGLSVKAGDTVYDAENFRNLYGRLMSLYRAGAAEHDVEGEPELVLQLQTNTESVPSSTIELYRYSASKFLAKHSGGEVYLVNAKTVEPLIDVYRNFLKGGAVPL